MSIVPFPGHHMGVKESLSGKETLLNGSEGAFNGSRWSVCLDLCDHTGFWYRAFIPAVIWLRL